MSEITRSDTFALDNSAQPDIGLEPGVVITPPGTTYAAFVNNEVLPEDGLQPGLGNPRALPRVIT